MDFDPNKDPAETSHRLFIALPLPEPITKPIAELVDRLQKGLQFTRCAPTWVKLESMHLTLRFLGKTLGSKVPEVTRALETVSKNFGPLSIQARDIGVFPHWKKPRVLWVGVRDKTDQLRNLQAKIERSVRELGFDADRFDFNPHLTLARIKSNRDIEAAKKIVEKREFFKTEFCPINEIVLFESQLTPQGAVHSPLNQLSFTGDPEKDV